MSVSKEILNLAQRHHFEKEHSQQVSLLALELFDQTRSLHNLEQKEKNFLEAACILHDIGRSNGGSRHHKIARDIIINSKGLPFEEKDQIIVALICRYHRKSLPQNGHTYYAKLDQQSKGIVEKLSSLIRVADGLDRSHLGLVQDLTLEVLEDKVILHVKAKSFCDMDKQAAEDKADLFQQVFDKTLVIDWPS